MDFDLLRSAFRATFANDGRPFGAAGSRWVGVSDDAKGVKWNAPFDRERGTAMLGVNLEGSKVNWIGIGPHKRVVGKRGPLVTLTISGSAARPWPAKQFRRWV
jgi:hypothetical protein